MKILLCTFKTTYKVLSLHPFLSYPTISNLLSAETIRELRSLIVHLVTNGHAFLQDPLRMQASFPSPPLMLFRFLPVCSGYALDRLVTVSSMHYCTSTSALSTSSSSRGLTTFVGISHLKGGFTLRCLQRLSLPDLATLPCLWQDNRYTSGRSSPVLSY